MIHKHELSLYQKLMLSIERIHHYDIAMEHGWVTTQLISNHDFKVSPDFSNLIWFQNILKSSDYNDVIYEQLGYNDINVRFYFKNIESAVEFKLLHG